VTGIVSQQIDEGLVLVKRNIGPEVYAPAVCQSEKDIPSKSYVGSKLVVLSADRLWLIRDDGKPLDWVGGQRKKNETPLNCLLRELKEEVGYDMSPSVPYYVGPSDSLEKTVFSRSHIFLCDAQSFGKYLERMEGFPFSTIFSDCQPWVLRISGFILDTFGSFYNAYRAFTHLTIGHPLGALRPEDALLRSYVLSHTFSWRKTSLSLSPCAKVLMSDVSVRGTHWKDSVIRGMLKKNFPLQLVVDSLDLLVRADMVVVICDENGACRIESR